jgi:CheY-like chemotaxis protein
MRPSELPQLRILVVDDDDMVRDTLKLILECDRHLVEAASSGSQALAMFQPGKFDLIITDYEMGDMKGDRLAAAIKSLAPPQPVLMVTAHFEAVQNDPSVMKNLAGLVPKPFGIEPLRDAIAHAVGASSSL